MPDNFMVPVRPSPSPTTIPASAPAWFRDFVQEEARWDREMAQAMLQAQATIATLTAQVAKLQTAAKG